MYLRDIAIWADDSIVDYYQGGFCQRFHEHTCCLVEFILPRIHNKVKTNNVSKLFFKLFHPNADFDINTDCFGGVLSINCYFDFDKYNSPDNSNYNKKKMIVDFLQNQIKQICTQYDWDISMIQDTFNELEHLNYRIQLEAKKMWVSPDKRFKTSLSCSYDIDEVVFEVQLFPYRGKNLLCKKHFGKVRPSDFVLYSVTKNCGWESNTVFTSSGWNYTKKSFYVDFSNEMCLSLSRSFE